MLPFDDVIMGYIDHVISLINDTVSATKNHNKTVRIYCRYTGVPWWRHQMEIFPTLLAFCAGNSPVIGDFTTQRSVTRSFDVFLDLRLNKMLSKQSWGWWFETPSWSLWRHCNAIADTLRCRFEHYRLGSRETQGMVTNVNWYLSFLVTRI